MRIVERGPGVYRVDHDPDKHDDQVVAIAMCATELISTTPGGLDAYLNLLVTEQKDLRPDVQDLFDKMTGQPLLTEAAARRLGYVKRADGTWVT